GGDARAGGHAGLTALLGGQPAEPLSAAASISDSSGTVPARASSYFWAMKRSSSAVSTRHCPRPPIWIASSSLRRTSAYTWRQDTLRMSATSASVRKRGVGMGPLRPVGASLSVAPPAAVV